MSYSWILVQALFKVQRAVGRHFQRAFRASKAHLIA